MTEEKPKVLVVDDEKSYLEDFLSLFSLKSEGRYEVLTAPSGEEALKLISHGDIAVIISDQRMPGMSGSELLARVATLSPQTVRVLLTGYADLDAVIDAVNRGEIYRYIGKEVTPKEIQVVIDQALDKFRIEEANRRLLTAKKRLLKSLAIQENLSIVGTFGQEIHQKLESMVMNLFQYVFRIGKSGDDQTIQAEFQRLQGALARLRELSIYSERIRRERDGAEKRNVNDLIQVAADQVRGAAGRFGGVKIHLDLSRHLPLLPVHRHSFLRVMKELLENAFLFGPKEGKEISIRSEFLEASGGDQDSEIRIEVKDNGAGIPALGVSKVFAPFYTTLPSGSSGESPPPPDDYNLGPDSHYGFGITIAQWIVTTRHNGTIELTSQPGKGTTAIVSIPVGKSS